MFAEEFVVVDATSPLWNAARPFLDIALRIEQQDDSYLWHGWNKASIDAFLQKLPPHCSLMLGVWQVDAAQEQETLWLGCICEVVDGAVCSLRTFVALEDSRLPAIAQLEPGYIHAQELIRVTKGQVAPVAWALFTDKTTWDEWLLAADADGQPTDKGEALAALARQGRCVLLGSQVTHHPHHH
ncbi:hypothetical protein [Dictyobacter kobayashii]|uniref:Uncharacterized protein n=1 Tax=Dictyobacter kobayashii TaxID=2014872 RepID=A0A402APQ4_9CHLR|nr:hypothetical protein [Dictyobacter kobayashii]GCE21005.1 hypothetical protein KDK_48050 [Dictyobacter kobayashii]